VGGLRATPVICHIYLSSLPETYKHSKKGLMLKNKTKKKNNVRRPIMPRPGDSSPLGRPPTYIANTYVSRVFRFQNAFSPGVANPQTFIITPTKLCALQGIVTTANTTVTMLYDAVKVRKVCLYCPASPLGDTITISLAFEGALAGTFGSDKMRSAQTFGSTIGAEVSLKPDPKSQASQWQPGDTTAGAVGLFTISMDSVANGSAIILTCDVYLTLRTTPSARTSGNTVSISSSSPLGSFVNLPLDSNAGSNGATGRTWLPDRNTPTAS